MKQLYVEVFVSSDGSISVPLETLIILFSFKFCDNPQITLFFVKGIRDNQPVFKLNINLFIFKYLSKPNVPADLCKLPVIVMHEETTCAAGVCAVVRHIFKTVDPMHPFLGFKQGCLYACAEASVWTKFCEIDLLKTVNEIFAFKTSEIFKIPYDIARFEVHLSHPVKVHNIEKVKQDKAKNTKGSSTEIGLEHSYAEGVSPSLADVILFPCFHLVFSMLNVNDLGAFIPLTRKWYDEVCGIEAISNALKIFGDDLNIIKVSKTSFEMPTVPIESLYKSDPRRYKPRHRLFTKQDEVEASLRLVETIDLDMVLSETFGSDISFDWESVPRDAQPEGGALPVQRIKRKGQQLENLARAVLKVAKQENRIVDFCAGSGHLGLILAHFLPRCTVVLLENKEESLTRARNRAQKLRLNNIIFCQSNVDYFVGNFEVGTSLHACGVATDLVMDCCVRQGAAFVCCPCCYGSLQPNHIVSYPRSEKMRLLPLSQREYLVLSHAADQTHDDANAKTLQGKICMNIIDADRCLSAREAGYWVSLSKLNPPSCTPKNNLLIGLPGLATGKG